MDIEKRVLKSVIGIMRSPDWAFLAGIIRTGELIPSDKTKTIATNGFDTFYNPEYLDNLTDEELNHTLLHVGLHKAYRHSVMWQGLRRKDSKRLDAAMDYQVNAEIEEVSKNSTDRKFRITRPGNAKYDSKYIDKGVPEIFHMIEPNEDNDDQQNDLSCDNPGGQQSQDDHELFSSEDLTEDQLDAIDTAIRQAAGQLPSDRARALQDANKVKRDWRELLVSEWASVVPGRDTQSWARTNIVYLNLGLYLPGNVAQNAKHVNFCIDTSGSITDEIIARAAQEVAHLAEHYPPKTLNIVWWDTKDHVQSVDRQDYAKVKDVMKPRGGGGTDPKCLDKHMEEDTFNIILTDGWFSPYTPRDPNTVFLLTEGGTAQYIKAGTVVEM